MFNDFMFNQTVTEMPNEYARWGNAGNIPLQMNEFYNNYMSFENELVCRTTQVRNHIQNNFNLPQQIDVTLDVFPAGAGKIHISTITPSDYPWQGVYFDGIPIRMEAIPNPGYSFLNWGANAQITNVLNPIFYDTLQSNLLFKAYFSKLPNYIPSIDENKSNFVLYPSPAYDQVTILCENQAILNEGNYEITTISGVKVQEGNLNKSKRETTISVNSLAPGVYFFHIYNPQAGMHWNIKFVKM